jgi:predicted metallopeptidase
MIDYAEAEDVEIIAKRLYKKFNLWFDVPKIKYLFRESEKSTFNAQISKATGKWAYLTDYDYIIEVWTVFWESATDTQKQALLYHELSHVECKEDDDGDITWRIREHDIEEFINVIKEYGTWNESLTPLKDIINSPNELDVLINAQQKVQEAIERNRTGDVVRLTPNSDDIANMEFVTLEKKEGNSDEANTL